MANAMLQNITDVTQHLKQCGMGGGLDFSSRGMLFDTGVGAQKLACLLQYFETSRASEGSFDDQREVIVERRSFEGSLQDFQEFCHTEGCAVEQTDRSKDSFGAHLHDTPMEAVTSDAFVNFANRTVG